ncbi:MAG: tRNA pseudouridine(38-40) synthase TruA [Proteobacteria bacterium]|nr:tRNA pseudouridine(38-40) synthase TruA [Pseudomonadota bacterium]
MELKSYKMIISYVGTEYCGWQVQAGVATVQGIIENLLSRTFDKRIILRYASRTDSGVHALGQVAGFTCESKFTAMEIQRILNTQLPQDIAIKAVEEVDPEFDPRKAKRKTYFYLIDNGEIRDPFKINRAWWTRHRLNKSNMLAALEYFKGKKDFIAFMGSGSGAKTTIREIYDISVFEKGDVMKISFTGNGFLKQMIRNIVGTVVEIGKGRFKPEDVEKMLKSRDRRTAGITAPAYGLYLERIYYE